MNRRSKKYIISAVLFLMLWTIMAFSVSALIDPVAIVRDNHFETGKVQLDINAGKPIFTNNDLNLAPAESITKAITVHNDGTVPVYYRLYFETHAGDLNRFLTMRLYKDGQEVFRKKASEWTMQSVFTASEPLDVGETVRFKLKATMTGNISNLGQNSFWKFDIIGEGVQVRNNPGQQFE